MTRKQAKSRVAELEREIEQLCACHYDLECEIEELQAKKKRFERRHKKFLARSTQK